MRTNEFVVARTHKDFLNDVLNLTLSGYQKSGKTLDDGKLLWMIRLNGEISKAGWINYMESSDRLIEEHVERDFSYQNHRTYVGSGVEFEDRVVFDVVEHGYSRKYVFRGVFRLDKSNCTFNRNVWYKISDKYIF
jgi:hypothetical protein